MALKAKQQGEFLVVNAPSEFNTKIQSDLTGYVTGLLDAGAVSLVVDFGGAADLGPQCLRTLTSLIHAAGPRKLTLRLVSSHPGFAAFLKRSGVDGLLRSERSVAEAIAGAESHVRRDIDVEFVDIFVVATVDVLKTVASTTATPGKLFMKFPGADLGGDISGVIDIVSKSYRGTIVISFPASTYLAIFSRMVGQTYTAIDDETRDGAGELINMIFGKAKVALLEKGYTLPMVIPAVVTGKALPDGLASAKAQRIVLPLASDLGSFSIEIGVAG